MKSRTISSAAADRAARMVPTGAGIAVVVASAVVTAAPSTYYLTDLGTLGGLQSAAADVNENSEVVGWANNASGQMRAFLWRNLVMTDLGVLPGATSSQALGLNNFGDVTGISGTRGFVWQDGVLTALPTLPGGSGVYPSDINDAGIICGYGIDSGINQVAFIWNAETKPSSLTLLPPPVGATQSVARALNNSADYAVDAFAPGDFRDAYLYDSVFGYRLIPSLGGNSIGYGINERGWICGVRYNLGGTPSGFVWRNSSTVTTVSPVAGFTEQVNYGLTRAGDSVGRSQRYLGGFDYEYAATIFLIGENRNYPLADYVTNLGDWDLESANAIGPGGMIAGFGTRGTSGATRAFLLTPIPTKGLVFLPRSDTRQIYVLDPSNGSPVAAIDVPWTNLPMELIDGNGSDLLLSDQAADTIWRLNPDGTNNGQFTVAPVDNIRGIAKSLGGYIVGGTPAGFRAWLSTGVEVPTGLAGDMWDVELLDFPSVKRYLISDIADNNVQSYDLDLIFRGQTTPGGAVFPEQIEIMTNNRFAVAAFSEAAVKVYNLRDGSLIRSVPVLGSPRGVWQIDTNIILVSTTTGLYTYSVSGGGLWRTILTGSGFRHLSQCRNFNP